MRAIIRRGRSRNPFWCGRTARRGGESPLSPVAGDGVAVHSRHGKSRSMVAAAVRSRAPVGALSCSLELGLGALGSQSVGQLHISQMLSLSLSLSLTLSLSW
jgi:hypothetical protein